ncbi:MAG TPA: biotin/lipoyl-binding protein [Candidatus Dormibacteraeota bacterium]
MIQPHDNVIQAFRSPNRNQYVAVAGLGLIALALAGLIGRDVFFPPSTTLAAVRTAAVTRGTVRSRVTGTGSVVPAQQINVGFRSAGQLTEVDVKVGDHVSKGQVLAKIDTRALQIALDQANANLTTAQANLANTENGTTLVQAQHALDIARTSYNDTLNQVNLTNAQDQAQLAADQAQLNSDQAQYNADNAALQNNATYKFDQTQLTTDQGKLVTDEAKFTADNCFANPSTPACTADAANVAADRAAVSADQARVSADTAATNGDSSKVAADQAKVNADNSKIAIDQLNGQRSLNLALNAITSAQDSLSSQTSSRPSTIAAQQAAIQSAQAAVDTAQLNLDQATLTAPMDGVINSLSGQVGEYVSASGGTTSLAPGTLAPAPSSSSSSSSASSGGSAFAVISNDLAFQVVVPFAEADAGRVAAGQAASVSFDAVQGLTVPSHVLATAAAATVVSNVVNYNTTLTLEQTDSRIRSGQTANVTVVVAQASNVLVVPNSAITRIGNRAFVTVLQAGGKQVRTPVTLGIAGDSSTEITGGLSAGDRVVLPQLRAGTTSGNAGRGTGGGNVRIGGGFGG